MSVAELRIKVIEEIQRIPREKLGELYDVIHFFRVGIEQTKTLPHNILQFAGCWEDMTDDEFDSFLIEIAERRSKAFSRRNQRETLIS